MNPDRPAAAQDVPAVLDPGSATFLPDRRRDPELGWHVLHTRSRNEKALLQLLDGMGIASYLPLRRVIHRTGGRRTESDLPVFPGYVFLWGTRDDSFRADRTRRVAQILPVTDQSRLEWELSNVHRALAGGAPLEPFPMVQDGVRVRVVSGPFLGLEGVVLSRSSADRLLLQVRMLNTSASLDIGGELVSPIDP